MGTRSVEETRRILADLDRRTLEERAQRLAELETIVYNGMDRTISAQMENFIDESVKNYENDCFRSSIFCSAGAVEYAYRHELVRLSEKPSQTLEEIRDKNFLKIIGMAEKYNHLRPFADDAHYIRKLRNEISAHPIYLAYANREKPEEVLLEKETTKEDVRGLIKFLDQEDPEISDLKEILEKPESLEDAIDWRSYSRRALNRLALKAWMKMRKIITGIYPLRE